MKKLINDPHGAVSEMLEGIVLATPGLTLLADENVVLRSDVEAARRSGVTLLSGGGAGHEPAHAGYVGDGMLTAAVTGDVFTSPSADAVLAGIRSIAGPGGVLLIVKNYTGDRLNFGLAAELAKAEGWDVETILVADDVALMDTIEPERRRGIAGTVLVHKVAGEAAKRGLPLADVARLARESCANLGSMGVSLNACTLPAVGKPVFELGAEEIEVGLGIHGEQGAKRMAIQSADALVQLVVDTILEDRGIAAGAQVALLVNGLGSTPPMELNIVARSALLYLEKKGISVARVWTGTFLSALDTPGFSLSIMNLDEERLGLLDGETTAYAWPGNGKLNAVGPASAPAAGNGRTASMGQAAEAPLTGSGKVFREAVSSAAKAILEAEAVLTDLDSIAGDGDLGTSLARGAQAMIELPAPVFGSPSDGLFALGNGLRRAIAGSSGPLYATGLLRASRHLASSEAPSARDWAAAFVSAVDAVSELGGARPGDRTMLDALIPAATSFSEAITAGSGAGDAWARAVEAAREGVERTKTMHPKAGRASYIGERVIGTPDGGAVAALVWLEAIAPFIGKRH